MKVLLDIKEDKAAFILELLENFNFVKAEPLTPYKAKVLKDLGEAIEEINLIKAGKKEAQPLREFLDGL